MKLKKLFWLAPGLLVMGVFLFLILFFRVMNKLPFRKFVRAIVQPKKNSGWNFITKVKKW
jgi:hypothetical protein